VSVRAAGAATGKPVRSLGRLVLGFSGLLLVVSLAKLLGRFILGYRRAGELAVDGDTITYSESVRLVGREIRKSTETIKRADVLSVQVEDRYPFALTLVGMVCLGIGILIGVVWILDGIQGEFTPWILSGVGVLLVGVLLDLALTTVSASLPGKVVLGLHLPGGRTVRLVGVGAEDAKNVCEAL
jgi:hypothetical protein